MGNYFSRPRANLRDPGGPHDKKFRNASRLLRRSISLDRRNRNTLSAEKANAIALRNQKESPFLRLPPEIRDAIYVYVLSYHKDHYCGLLVHSTGLIEECKLDSFYTLMSLTRTCRQLHAESALVFFEINPLGARTHRPMLSRWKLVNQCTEEQRQSVKFWWIEQGDISKITTIDEPFDLLPGLQTITITPGRHCGKATKEDEARVRDLVRAAVGKDLPVLFEYPWGG